MKKALAALLSFMLLLSVAACSSNNKASSESASWPRSEIAKIVPQPDFGTVKISFDTASSLSVEVSKVSQDQFSSYVETCMNKGFTVDYTKTNSSFSAKNEEGYSISVFYWESKKNMDIMADSPSDDESSSSSEIPTQEPDPTAAPAPEISAPESSAPEESTPADGIRPEFKEAMDSYEAFYEEYAEFMKKYKESGNALELLGEYTEYMQKLSDFTEKFNKWDESEMSDEELKYYLDIQTRVSKILIDVAS